jgi:ABC-type ATPase with predicted acetyltransferase domain
MMTKLSISKRFTWDGPLTDKGARLCRMFGLTVERLTERAPTHTCRLDLGPGDIVYITGPSGAGKSVLLCEIKNALPAAGRVSLDDIPIPDDSTVIDCFDGDVVTTLRTLSTVGLSEVFAILNRPCHLSAGQKYRYRLAQALAVGKPFVLADEFCSELDRVTAATVAYNIHKFAKRTQTTFVLASSHDDILIDLVPDLLVVKDFSGPAEVIHKGLW